MISLKTLVRSLLNVVPVNVQRAVVRKLVHALPDRAHDMVAVDLEIASVEWSLRQIKRLGFVPDRIIDIGACSGHWTQMVKGIFPEAEVLMLEARESERPALAAAARVIPGVEYRIALLGPAPASKVAFAVTDGGTGSSVYAELSDVPRHVEHLPMQTLDMVAELGTHRTLLKLDVQGYELEVLRGGKATLASSEVVLMESAVWTYNDGAPCLEDVVRFMREAGFHLYDICSLIRRYPDNLLTHTDLMFVRSDSLLLATRRSSQKA